jgi:hypothetical protein
MSSKLSELIKELDRQKQMYHEKLLSVDGEFSLMLRTFQIYDLIIDISNLLIPEFFMSSLIGSLTFSLDLSELEPLNLEFDFRFPTLDEWMNGVSIVIEKIVPDYVYSLYDFIIRNIKDLYQEDIFRSLVSKCVYGRSAYGKCYADPQAVREFLRASLYKIFNKHYTYTQRRLALDSLAETLELNTSLVRMLHDKISMTITLQTECFTLGYSVLSKSRLCQSTHHSPQLGILPYVDYDGNVVEAQITKLADAQFGFILGVSVLGFSYLMPMEDIYKSVFKELVKGSFVYGSPEVFDALKEKLDRFRRRISITPQAFSNYTRGDEAADYHKADRTEIWGELMSMRYTSEAYVDVFLRSVMPDLDPFTRRKYVTAALQLIGHVGKRHRWGFNVYKTLEDQDLKNQWISYWREQGLDPAILENLYENMKTWLPDFIRKKLDLGRKLRLERLKIPLD